MNNAEPNPPRQEQEEQARQSPMKGSATETAHASPQDIGKATADQQGPQAQSEDADADQRPYGNETEHPRPKAMLPEDVHPRGVDVDNDDASDSTVDTDGKDRDAKRLGRLDDSEVVSNASSDNAELPPAEGLAGIDSRPRIPDALGPGVVIDEGFAENPRLYETAGDGSNDEAVKKTQEHVPPNHTRVGKTIKLDAADSDD